MSSVENIKELEGSVAESYWKIKVRHIEKVTILKKGLFEFCEMARKPKSRLPITVKSLSVKVKELVARQLHKYSIIKSICTANEE